jgi:hypothetical protein
MIQELFASTKVDQTSRWEGLDQLDQAGANPSYEAWQFVPNTYLRKESKRKFPVLVIDIF